MRSGYGLSPNQVYSVAGLALIALISLSQKIPPNDYWWHIAEGRAIVESGHIPSLDAGSFTHPGAPFFDQPWLAQLLMYALFRLGGSELLVFVQAVLLTAVFGVLLRLMARRSDGRVRTSVALLTLAVLPASASNLTIRPQSYAFL